ncbi:MAG: hypothetical protein IPG53_18715 [Ignavibacteriales bacterium]|nr:hypothetical protein [Ignavibacteriales bacterium]
MPHNSPWRGKKWHGKGFDGIMYKQIIDRADEIGIHFGDASWIVEDNEKMVRGALMMEGELYKKFRVYDYTFKYLLLIGFFRNNSLSGAIQYPGQKTD